MIRSAKSGLVLAALMLVVSSAMPARQARDVPDPLCRPAARIVPCADQATSGSFMVPNGGKAGVIYGGGQYGRR